MICKSCGNEIPEGSIFCNWCGERQVKQKKSKTEIKVPKPTQLPSGSWRIRLQAEGQSITEATPELCIAKATAIRAGFLNKKKKAPRLTLSAAIDAYIQKNSNILSPSTLRGYEGIKRSRFKDYMEKDVSAVDWQEAVNVESALCGAKTLKNAWGFVSTILRENGMDPPDVHLPKVPPKELPWLNPDQIQTLLAAVQGEPCEFAVLFALHSLRRSELLAVTPSMIYDGFIHVTSSLVPNAKEEMILRHTNKTTSSTRAVPVIIPRLQELVDAYDGPSDQPFIRSHPNTAYIQINKVCKKAGLPCVGVHGLRRSFASLAYHLGWPERVTMQIGGWSDWQTMHKIYIKLDQNDVNTAANKMRTLYSSFSEIDTNLDTPLENG